MHQLVISDHKGGGFSLDSYSVHYKVFILLEYYVCLYLEIFQRCKKIPLSFPKNTWVGGVFHHSKIKKIYAMVFLRRG